MVYPPKKKHLGGPEPKKRRNRWGLKFKIHFRGDLDIWGDHLEAYFAILP